MRPTRSTQSNRGQASDLIERARRKYLDDLVDDYVSWREACGTVSLAYDNYKRAGREDRKLAFNEYIAALDCEEGAATVYQRSVEQLAAMNAHATPVACGTAREASP